MALPKYVKIFDIRKQETKNGPAAKVVFAKGIEITYNGEKVDLGQYSGGFLKKTEEVIASLEKVVASGALSEEFAQKQVEFMESKNVSSVFEVSTVKRA